MRGFLPYPGLPPHMSSGKNKDNKAPHFPMSMYMQSHLGKQHRPPTLREDPPPQTGKDDGDFMSGKKFCLMTLIMSWTTYLSDKLSA